MNELFPRDFSTDFARFALGLSGVVFTRSFVVSFKPRLGAIVVSYVHRCLRLVCISRGKYYLKYKMVKQACQFIMTVQNFIP